ncbi:class I SAM-dependent methyltransferase [Azospirillum agricola]|uniref:class I SAM-dependent methyltransferase n=1 Tax=Azospirillum agricola TaxID=1720247 RepID=UPI0015C42CC9|nr:methyltransferase domain-containing protein [Azospirillum agricola]
MAGDALALPQLLAGRERSFDVVTLLDVIEHVRDPVGLLRDAAAFVAPGGCCWSTHPTTPA